MTLGRRTSTPTSTSTRSTALRRQWKSGALSCSRPWLQSAKEEAAAPPAATAPAAAVKAETAQPKQELVGVPALLACSISLKWEEGCEQGHHRGGCRVTAPDSSGA